MRKVLNELKTPNDLDVTKGTIIAPPGGWEKRSWYAVDVAFSATNPIHEGIVFTGYNLGAYAFVITSDGSPESIRSAYYLKGIRKLNVEN